MSEIASLPAGFAERLFRLDGRVAVVTGGGSGLGAAVAAGYAQSGATVALLDVDSASSAAVVRDIELAGGAALDIECDVTDGSAVRAAAERIHAATGWVDVLVDSAGTAFRSPAVEFPEDAFDRGLGINLKGTYLTYLTYLTCQAFGRLMLKQRSASTS